MISIIIPVFQEADHINHCLQPLLKLPDAELVVIDGAPDQDTLAAITSPRVLALTSAPGRGVQMNCGAARAKGEILLFLHADTILPPNALDLIRRALRNPDLCGGAFQLRYASPRPIMTAIAALANLRSNLTRVPYGDQALFLRTKVFQDLGGFASVPIMEDLELMTRLRRCGLRIKILPEAILTSARRHEREGAIRCTLRNLLLRLLYHLGLSPRLLVRLYR